MKKNNMMRVAACLLVAVMLTTCAISGTFAKYTSTVTTTDTARVAYWGFNSSTATLNLFSYEDAGVKNTNGTVTGLLAPGTTGKATLDLVYTDGNGGTITAPEVDYKLEVTADVACDEELAKVLTFTMGNGNETKTPAQIKAAIEAAAGEYEAGTLPDIFNTGIELGWTWAWAETDAANTADTALGNAATLDGVTVTITITATQINE